ncbi:hypothetical protein D3C77_413760 [compost metagenome]
MYFAFSNPHRVPSTIFIFVMLESSKSERFIIFDRFTDNFVAIVGMPPHFLQFLALQIAFVLYGLAHTAFADIVQVPSFTNLMALLSGVSEPGRYVIR